MTDLTKRRAIRSDAIRKAAYGEACCVCDRNDGTTVFCHLNESWAGKGMGQKADDIGFFGCSECHDMYDGRNIPDNASSAIGLEDWLITRAMYRTWKRLVELKVITIKGYEP